MSAGNRARALCERGEHSEPRTPCVSYVRCLTATPIYPLSTWPEMATQVLIYMKVFPIYKNFPFPQNQFYIFLFRVCQLSSQCRENPSAAHSLNLLPSCPAVEYLCLPCTVQVCVFDACAVAHVERSEGCCVERALSFQLCMGVRDWTHTVRLTQQELVVRLIKRKDGKCGISAVMVIACWCEDVFNTFF